MSLRAPFPWFGGKRRVADVVWRAFGHDVNNYVEPFAGSLAVLLARPGGPGKIETVNDRDRYIANFWRAVTAEPELVAEHCDWPVNEADLHARHKWLVAELPRLREQMHTDPDYYDAKIAGWWVWGICQWIGGGWCAEPNNHKHPKLDGIGKGVHSERGAGRSRAVRSRQRPSIQGDSTGMGVHSERVPRDHRGEAPSEQAKRPTLAGMDRGVLRAQLPDLGVVGDKNGNVGTGRGVVANGLLRAHERAQGGARLAPQTSSGAGVHLPGLGNDRGIHGVSAAPCTDWFRMLQERLRRVRVACGDWTRVLGPSVLGKGKNVGGRRPCAVFLDPPYSHEFRDPGLYSEDDASVSALARDWAVEHGDDPDLRIALCGYEGEHAMPESWACVEWKAARGYAGADNDNRERERIWFSPHCLKSGTQQALFATDAAS